jgi:hypothetical protein
MLPVLSNQNRDFNTKEQKMDDKNSEGGCLQGNQNRDLNTKEQKMDDKNSEGGCLQGNAFRNLTPRLLYLHLLFL